MVQRVAVLALLVTLVGCYHATIETGLPAGSQVVEVPWAHSFIVGLIPPSTVDAASECPNGVARVETQHSFLNGVAAALTWSLYTPMHITVTCAAGSSMDQDGPDAEVIDATSRQREDVTAALEAAAARSWASARPVYVRTVGD